VELQKRETIGRLVVGLIVEKYPTF